MKIVSIGMDEQMRALISKCHATAWYRSPNSFFFCCHQCRQTYEQMDGQTDGRTDGRTVGPTDKPSQMQSHLRMNLNSDPQNNLFF